jgi:sugar phosphate isomerase/epimerase
VTRLAVQSRLVPGDSLREQHENARRYGFDGLELSGFPMIDLAREALRDGVPVTAMCSGHRGWFIDPDPAQVEACIEDTKVLLELGAELDAPLIVVPIYGRTNKLPNSGTGRSAADDERLWLEGLREVTRHADRVGGSLVVEGINRYENSVSVTVADAVRWARAADSPRVRAMGDVFHMNIEEQDFAMSFLSMGDMLAYVHLADSQRLEPGRGHLDWASVFDGLERLGYDGYASMECNLSGPADEVLPAAVAFLRGEMARARERLEGAGRAPGAAANTAAGR